MKNLRTGTAKFDTIRAKDANGLSIQDDGGNGLFIKDGGNVGIGTANPINDLHLHSATTGVGPILQLSNDTGDCRLFFGTDSTTGGANAAGQIRYTVANNHMSFYSSSNERMRIDSSGNVGIGTTNPGDTRLSISPSADGKYALQVKNSAGTDRGGFYINSDNSAALYLKDSSSNNDIRLDTTGISYLNGGNVGIGTTSPDNSDWNANAKILHIHKNDPAGGMIKCSSSVSSLIFSAGNIGYIGTSTNHDLGLYTNAEQKMTIKAGGNVGIGTKDPGGRLHVVGDFGDPSTSNLITRLSQSSGNGVCDIGFMAVGATSGGSWFQSRNSSDSSKYALLFNPEGGNVGIGTKNPLWTFHPVSNVANNAISRFENISSDPYGIQIKYTSDPDNSTSNWFLDCKGGNTSRFVVYSDGDAWTTDSGVLSSDERLKTNIVDATPKLEDIKKLKVRNFEWIPEFHPAKVGEKKIGFIAQELEQVFPGLVDEHDMNLGEEEISRKSVRLGALIPILVKGMQEQQSIIEDLKSQNASLESRISALES